MKLLVNDDKKCGRCHITKLVSEFGTWKNVSGLRVSTLDCKKCRAEYQIKRNRASGMKPRNEYPVTDGHKECADCHTIKPISDYWKGTNQSGTITYNRLCKICKKKDMVVKARLKGVQPLKKRIVIDGHSECSTCHIMKPLSAYELRKKKDGSPSPFAHCKECTNKKQTEALRAKGIQPKKYYPVIDGMKLCSKCNVTKPISEYSNNRCHCKECMIVYYTKQRRARGVQFNKWYPVIDGCKQCTRCNQIKPVVEFGTMSRNLSGLRPHCSACDLEKSLQWRRAKGMVPNTFIAHPIIDGLKQCYVCNENLAVNKFLVNKKGYTTHSCRTCTLKKERPLHHKYYKRSSEQLTDGYLTMVLSSRSKNGTYIRKEDIPQNLFNMLRTKLKLQRELRQLKNQ